MKRILVIEDDLALREELLKLLRSNSYEALAISNYENVLEQINTLNPSLILLDINLPNCNGEFILKELRSKSNVPVIMVTSYNSLSDEVLSMSYGADDYITKPYNPTLLLLRIEAIFKRMENHYPVLHYKEVELIPDKCIMVYQNKDYYLTKNEMLIFKYLILHKGVLVKREDLMRYLWDSEEFVDDNTLSVNISRLRKKLLDVSLAGVIETRKGLGYYLK